MQGGFLAALFLCLVYRVPRVRVHTRTNDIIDIYLLYYYYIYIENKYATIAKQRKTKQETTNKMKRKAKRETTTQMQIERNKKRTRQE